MTTYTAQAITADGLVATYNNAAAGDKINPDANVFITVKNGSGGSITVQVAPAGNTKYGVANPVKTFTVAASGERDIPMLSDYINPSDGLIALTWSATPSVTFAVKRV